MGRVWRHLEDVLETGVAAECFDKSVPTSQQECQTELALRESVLSRDCIALGRKEMSVRGGWVQRHRPEQPRQPLATLALAYQLQPGCLVWKIVAGVPSGGRVSKQSRFFRSRRSCNPRSVHLCRMEVLNHNPSRRECRRRDSKHSKRLGRKMKRSTRPSKQRKRNRERYGHAENLQREIYEVVHRKCGGTCNDAKFGWRERTPDGG